MTTEKCLVNTYCLNQKINQQKLLKYISNIINNKKELLYKDFGFYLRKDKNYKFKLTPIINKKKMTLYIFDKKSKKDELSYCLKMSFDKIYKKDNLYYFKKSKVDNVNRGVCGINKKVISVTLDGTYLIKLVDLLNNIFKVETSTLDDDARLDICDQVIKIKLIKLISEGKTWYEKSAGFKLKDDIIYEYTNNVSNSTFEYFYDIMKNIKFSPYDGDFSSLNIEEFEKTLNILQKYDLTKKDKLRKIIKRFFDSKHKDVKNCDKAHIYKYILDLPKRNLAYKSKDSKYDIYKNYIDLLIKLSSFNESVKKY